jgi:Tfp pilus assembly protein PilF
MVRSVKSTSEEVTMRELTAAAFAGRLHEMLEVPDCKLVWFLGAGCSISSGVPGAAALVNSWLPRLKTRETGSDDDWQTWATTKFPEFDPNNAARSYGAVMDELFPLSYERQQEVERITSNCDPAIGYALFSVLAAHEEHGPKSNIVLTTNFDDLIADSLYLLTRKKPLVVAHESLAAFARASRRRPLIVKVHGDARLAPRNTADETRELESELVGRVTSLMSGSGLIFSGYAGNDVSISRLLNGVPDDSFPLGIYWIGMAVPDGPVGDWLRTRPESFHVKHHDFDGLMMQIAERIDLSLPGIDRFRDLFDGWAKALLRTEVSAGAGAGTEPDVGRAASRLRRDLGGLRAVARAEELVATDPKAALFAFEEAIAADPEQAIVYSAFAAFLARNRKDFDRAEAMYERAIAAGPERAATLGNYAVFLARNRKDFDRAEAMYERAIAAGPENAATLGNYAAFLAGDRKDFDRAGAMYERAIAAGPERATILGNYAAFLARDRKDFDRAGAMYERAIAAGPEHANNLGNYALFVDRDRKDFDRAEAMYERALAADPENAATLGNYAAFLAGDRKDFDRAGAMYERAIAADPENANKLGNYALFLDRDRKDFDRAEAMYERAIAAGPENANNLGNYALFLARDRKDFDRAEAMYERAIAADPEHANNLGSYATFLARDRKDFDRAGAMFERAIAADPENANNLGNYALFLHRDRKDFDRAEAMYERAIAAGPENANNLGNYALFLAHDRKDFDRAEAMYERAIAADPEHANNLGNYAQLLFARGDEARANPLAQMLLKRKDLPPDLRVELLYYRVADGRHADSAGPALRSSIDAGERSKGWDLSMNVDRAAAVEDGRLAFLRQLAAVVADEVPAETLDDFETWKSWRKRS